MRTTVASTVAFLPWIFGVCAVAKAKESYVAAEERGLGLNSQLSPPKLRGRASFENGLVPSIRRLQRTWLPYQPYKPIDPTLQVDPYVTPSTMDDGYSSSNYIPAYPGKGKGSFPASPSEGKGKGSAAPPTWSTHEGKGKGSVLYSQTPKESKRSKGNNQPLGKGNGWVPSPSFDDDYVGKGSIVPMRGKGKGSVPPPRKAIGKGHAVSRSGDTPENGKGGWTFPVFRPLENFEVGPYPGLLPSIGKGKGTDSMYPSAVGEGKGSPYSALQPSNLYYSSKSCKLRWDGVAPVPDDMWLDQNYCLHRLPPSPPQPPIPSSPQPLLKPTPQSTVAPLPVPSSPITRSTVPIPLPPSTQPPSATLSTTIPTKQANGDQTRPPFATVDRNPAYSTLGPTPKAIFSVAQAENESNVDGLPVQTKFVARYRLNSAVAPSAENFDAAVRVTSAYLQKFLEDFYGQSPFSTIVGFSRIATKNNGAGDPALISFYVTLIFSPDSPFVPTADAIDVLLGTAFSPPAVKVILDQLRALGADNPFSNTVNVEFSPGEIIPREKGSSQGENNNDRSKSHILTVIIFSMVATATSLVIVVGFVTMRRKRKQKPPEEEDEGVVILDTTTKIGKIVEAEKYYDSSVVATDAAVSEKDSESMFDEATQDLD